MRSTTRNLRFVHSTEKEKKSYGRADVRSGHKMLDDGAESSHNLHEMAAVV